MCQLHLNCIETHLPLNKALEVIQEANIDHLLKIRINEKKKKLTIVDLLRGKIIFENGCKLANFKVFRESKVK